MLLLSLVSLGTAEMLDMPPMADFMLFDIIELEAKLDWSSWNRFVLLLSRILSHRAEVS